jgi:uncharacterized protein with ParB-like and HNH nuclease domain
LHPSRGVNLNSSFCYLRLVFVGVCRTITNAAELAFIRKYKKLKRITIFIIHNVIMKDTFIPLSLTIKSLFGNSESLFQIPKYQRPYSWLDEQVDQLWDDLYTAFENNQQDQGNDGNYFLGSIIVVSPESTSSYFDVVDGQQRITTLMILFCAIRDTFPNINSEVDIASNPSVIKMSRIKKCIFDDDDRDRLKFYTHSHDHSNFEKQIINGNISELSRPFKYQIKSEPKFRFINTAVSFREKLLEKGEKNIGEFINYLFNQVNLIKIECTSRSFAIKLFQVLNDRGMDLSNSDLIKSYLMSKIGDNKKKEEQFIADWQNIEQLKKNIDDVSMDDLFIFYEYYNLGSNPKKSLSEEFETLFKNEDPNKVISDFRDFVYLYKTELEEKHEKVLNSLWYIRWNMYFKTILLTALHTKYKDYDKLVWELRRFYYLNWIAGKTLTKIKQTSFNLIGWIKDKKSISDIRIEFDAKLEADKVIPDAIKALKGDVYGELWAKPLLLSIEYQQTDNTAFQYIELSDKNLHIEHILPIKFTEMKDWGHFDNSNAKEKINSLGNLTLLSGAKNIEASNNSFAMKISVYNGTGKYGSDDKGITGFRMTQKIVDEYNAGKFDKKWTEQSIETRFNWFCLEIKKMLEIDIS